MSIYDFNNNALAQQDELITRGYETTTYYSYDMCDRQLSELDEELYIKLLQEELDKKKAEQDELRRQKRNN